MQTHHATKKPNQLCLILLISFPSVAAVLISPALPAISDFFDISNGYAQQLVTIFVIGYAVGQLIYSPFANRFGRKIAIYIGIVLYLISCLICLYGISTADIEILFLGRLLMALGSSVGMVISFTIINDYYRPEQARTIISYTVLAYAFMPAVAIATGGFITSHFSWIYCFYFYVFYGVLIVIVSMRLPETLIQKELYALKFKPLIMRYFQAFSTWRLILFSSIYGMMSAFIYIIASGAPFIAIDTIGLSSAHYGFLLFIPYSGQIVGSIISGKLSRYISAYQTMKIGYGSTLFGSLFMFINFAFHWVTAFSLLAPMFFIMLGLPMTYSSVTVMALTGYPDKATGSAIMSFITMSVALLGTFILTVLPNQNPLIMPSLFIGIFVLAIAAFWHALRRFSE